MLGLTLRPTGPPNAVQAWDWKNAEAHAELHLAVKWDQLVHMTPTNTLEIWAKLEHIHQATEITMHMGLKWQLWRIKMKDDQRMASWISDVKGVIFQLSQIGVNVPDEDIILTLTNGLPPSYQNFVLMLNSTPSKTFNLDYVIICLQTEETHQHTESRSQAMVDHTLAIIHDQLRWPLAFITCFSLQKHAPVPCHENKPINAATATEEAQSVEEADGFFFFFFSDPFTCTLGYRTPHSSTNTLYSTSFDQCV